jgi:hypothetical protein
VRDLDEEPGADLFLREPGHGVRLTRGWPHVSQRRDVRQLLSAGSTKGFAGYVPFRYIATVERALASRLATISLVVAAYFLK